MRVFVTGATGFIGSALVADLIAAGHEVLGLTRTEVGAQALMMAGAQPHRGRLDDLESLKRGAAQSDGVVHLAFNHDFSTYMQNCEDDRRAIEAIASALKGSDRPLLVTSGTGMVATPGRPCTEDDAPASSSMVPRAASEEAAAAAAADGINAGVVRLPQVHDVERQGLVSYVIQVALQKGFVAYVGEGRNRWPAAPVADVARLYRLALERGERGARWHAVAEEGVAMRAIAETLGPRLDLPVKSITSEQAGDYFGWMAMFAANDAPASSEKTRAKLGWTPAGRGLLADLEDLRLTAAVTG
jgi:nucleoside-diphosphate-sugar epimerase